MIKQIFLSSAILLTTPTAISKDYVVDDYSFTWTVAESGNTSLLIEKTDEKLRVIIRKKSGISFDLIYLSPEEAKEVGIVLAKANEFYNKQKDNKVDTSEIVKVGNYTVTYLTSTKHGFSAIIRQSELIAIGGLVLDRKEALVLSEKLNDITEKAEFLKNLIKL